MLPKHSAQENLQSTLIKDPTHMKIFRSLNTIFFVFILMACLTAQATHAQVVQSLCPSIEFSTFLEGFSSETSTQQAFTKIPLHKKIVVNGDPEPVQKKITLKQYEIKFPVIPDPTKRQRDGLILRPFAIESKQAKALLEKPDTDYRVIYIFQLDTCWQLIEIVDESL